MGSNHFAFMHGLLARGVGQRVPALHNGFMEQSSRKRRSHQRQHAARTGRLAKYGDVLRIAAERGNVIAHPFQGLDLIEQRKVMHHAFFFPLKRRMGKKAEVSETVINCHHHRAALRQRPAVIRRQTASAECKSSAVQPDHHRKRIGAYDWRPDVKVQAVFRELARIAAAQLLTAFAALPAGGGERRRRTHAIPACRGAWGAPAPRANRRCRIRNATPHMGIAFSRTN